MAKTPFTLAVIECIRAIPKGRVATYGGIARLAGSARAARQVVRVLHTCSRNEELPWHRVVNREGRIGLKSFQGAGDQLRLLKMEGVAFSVDEAIELNRFMWLPTSSELATLHRLIAERKAAEG